MKSKTMLIISAILATCVLFMLRCDDSDMAKVTLHLQRNDLAQMKFMPKKYLIDRILEFFSTPAEAGGTNWDDTHGILSLTITGPNIETKTHIIPSGVTIFTTLVPAVKDVTFTVISEFDGNNNWGGKYTMDLDSGGSVVVPVIMKPMTWFYNLTASSMIDVWWETIDPVYNAVSYNIYRSTSSNGPFTLLYNETNISAFSYSDGSVSLGVTYYYKISVVTTDGEGLPSDVISGQPM